MSRMGDKASNISDDQLDRLVDGELSEPQRRELLSGLDREPEGWRRCALAFLEGQSWREAMRSMAGAASGQMLTSNPAPSPVRRPSWLTRHTTLLATAASFTVALVVSSIVWPMLYQVNAPAVQLAGVAGNGRTDQPANGLPAAAPWQGPAVASHAPWRMVTVSVPGPQGTSQPIQVPAVEQDGWNGALLGKSPQALPPALLQAFEQSGRRVQQSRQLLSVPLEDGRRLVLPVDQFEIHYVGNRDYQ